MTEKTPEPEKTLRNVLVDFGLARAGTATPGSEEAKRLSHALKPFVNDELALSALLRTCIMAPSPERARFAAHLFHKAGWAAGFEILKARAEKCNLRAWEKARFAQDVAPAEARATAWPTRFVEDLTLASSPDSLASAIDALIDAVSGAERTVFGLPVVVRVPPEVAVETVLDLVRRVSALPVAPVFIFDDWSAASAFCAGLDPHDRKLLWPVVVARLSRPEQPSGSLGIVSLGGHGLFDPVSPKQLQISEGDLLWLCANSALMVVYGSAAFAPSRPRLLTEFARTIGRVFPRSVGDDGFALLFAFVGTPKERASMLSALAASLLGEGYFAQAAAILELVPERDRDAKYWVRFCRANFGTGNFKAVSAAAESGLLTKTSKKLVAESCAALAMLDELQQLLANPRSCEWAVSEQKVVSVLHASAPSQSGGYAVRAHELVKNTVETGLSLVAYTRPGYPEGENSLAVGEVSRYVHDGVVYGQIGSERLRIDGEYQYMAASVGLYEDVFRAERPTVVHLRSTYVSALPALIAAKRVGLPTVYEVSGMWELVYEASDDPSKEGRRARTVRLEDAVLAHADRVCTMTEAMRSLIDSRVMTVEPVEIIPNAVNLKALAPVRRSTELLEELGWPPDCPIVGYIGSFVDYEGLDILVRALAVLRNRGVVFRALFVGDGAVGPRIRQLASDLGLTDEKVVFTGRVPHVQVSRFYSLIDVCAYRAGSRLRRRLFLR